MGWIFDSRYQVLTTIEMPVLRFRVFAKKSNDFRGCFPLARKETQNNLRPIFFCVILITYYRFLYKSFYLELDYMLYTEHKFEQLDS